MDSIAPFLSVAGSARGTTQHLRTSLSRLGLRVLQTFDLSEARQAVGTCPCPHHGDAACDCEMRVLLIYADTGAPATLVLHGNHGHTWLSLVDAATQPPAPSLQLAIERALQEYHA